jgi:hypothetical protein
MRGRWSANTHSRLRGESGRTCRKDRWRDHGRRRPYAREISETTMRDAIILANWYVNEAKRLSDGGRADPRLRRAATLLKWLQAQPQGMAGISAILTHGPHAMRTKDAVEEALKILAAHGWTAEVSQRPRVIKTVGEPRQ